MVVIVLLFYYKLSFDGVYVYFYEIVINLLIDVMFYNILMFVFFIDVLIVKRLVEECFCVVVIKDFFGDFLYMMWMIVEVCLICFEFLFLMGWDVVLMLMLLFGCDGGMNVISGVVFEIICKFYELII